MTIFKEEALRGKVAVVTGAAHGIGRASAVASAAAGAKVAGLDIRTSASAKSMFLNGASYSASKWGIIGLMKSAALELGRHKIAVNALIPGLIDTPMTRNEDRYLQAIAVGGKQSTSTQADDEQTATQSLAAKLPLGLPWLEPESIAPAVVFLASEAAALVSGTSLAVTGRDSANVTA